MDGAPALLNPPANPTPPEVMKFDTVTISAAASDVPWGIYRDGEPVVKPDSVIAMDFQSERQIADYPQEEGAFQSYSKVAKPFDIRLRMTKAGQSRDRREFLTVLERLLASLEPCYVLTPDRTYTDVSVVGLDYARTATNGAGMVTADVILREVRITATAAFAKTKEPSGADPVSGGTVQTRAPTSAELAALHAGGI